MCICMKLAKIVWSIQRAYMHESMLTRTGTSHTSASYTPAGWFGHTRVRIHDRFASSVYKIFWTSWSCTGSRSIGDKFLNNKHAAREIKSCRKTNSPYMWASQAYPGRPLVLWDLCSLCSQLQTTPSATSISGDLVPSILWNITTQIRSWSKKYMNLQLKKICRKFLFNRWHLRGKR
jgi:hypothetical protein